MSASDWMLRTDAGGYTRHFAEEALPVTIGGGARDDVRLPGVSGTAEIDRRDGAFVVSAGEGAANLRVAGERVDAPRELADGDEIALDTARLGCRFDRGRLLLDIRVQQTAGATAPPDLEELAREARADDEVEVTPIAFRSGEQGSGEPGRRRVRPAALIAAFGFAVLLGAAWFAFTAKSVALDFEPQPQSIELPDTLLKLHVADRFLLRPGTHRVTAELPGYYPLETEVDVGEAQDQSFELELVKLPEYVELSTDPETGAEVLLDGEPIGRTPMTAEIRPGTHRLAFRAERYLDEVREIDVDGGGERRRLSIELTPNWAPVQVSTEPAGATVLVDGEPVGTTPAELELTAGERELEVRLAGYNAWRDRISVTADEPLALSTIALTEADGRVELRSTPAEAAVSVDGEFRGRTPVTLRLRPGRAHRIALSKTGYETVTRELSVEADSGRRLDVELPARYGEVEVASEPPDAEIRVDGEPAGRTPATLRLTALPHTVEVSREGYAAQSDEITPAPGFAQSLRFELEALNETSGDGYPKKIRTGLDQELTLVPAGSFTMGSSRRERGRRSNEVLRRVELSRAFYLGVREVSNAEFRAFAEDHDSGAVGEHSLNGDDQPVVNVGWDDAARFLNWLSIEDGLQPVYEEQNGRMVAVRPLRSGYRLPTEAEWAWAARFAEREAALVFPWGSELPPPDRSGNFADLSAADVLETTLVTYNDGFPVTAPSGSFAADAVGAFDLGGNVAEWVQDFYEIAPGAGTERAVDPLGPTSGQFRVVRGPSWRSATVTNLRLAYREAARGASDDVGFRIARNLE